MHRFVLLTCATAAMDSSWLSNTILKMTLKGRLMLKCIFVEQKKHLVPGSE
jgi:hypothetical protein